MYLATTFLIARVVARDRKLVTLIQQNFLFSKKYIIASLEGRDARISATLVGDTIRGNASLLTPYPPPVEPNPPPPPAKNSEITMPSAYIRSLQRSLEAETATQQLYKPRLKQRFLDWFDSVPEISRVRPYSMVELEQALGTQGKFLSPVLLSLGWERRRKWSSKGQSPRYWVPPDD